MSKLKKIIVGEEYKFPLRIRVTKVERDSRWPNHVLLVSGEIDQTIKYFMEDTTERAVYYVKNIPYQPSEKHG